MCEVLIQVFIGERERENSTPFPTTITVTLKMLVIWFEVFLSLIIFKQIDLAQTGTITLEQSGPGSNPHASTKASLSDAV